MMVSTVGRPLKFGEPLIPRQFRLPEKLNGDLNAEARRLGRDVSDLLREGLEWLLYKKSPALSADQVRQALREELQAKESGLMLRVDADERKLLEKQARRFEYDGAEEFLTEVALCTLYAPDAVDSLLLASGQVEQEKKIRAARRAQGAGATVTSQPGRVAAKTKKVGQ